MSKTLIELKQVSKHYDDGKQNKLDVFIDINWSLNFGESIAIQGTSGSGKSTFLHLISGLDQPSAGTVLFKDQNINKLSDAKKSNIRNHSIGFIYQFHHLIQEMNIYENIILPIQVRKKMTKEDYSWANYLIDKVGLSDKINHFPSELSGGQRQRVAIARSMINKPECIIADEPTGNLDQKNAENISSLLINLQKQQKGSLVIATHDHNLARECAHLFELKNCNLHKIT